MCWSNVFPNVLLIKKSQILLEMRVKNRVFYMDEEDTVLDQTSDLNIQLRIQQLYIGNEPTNSSSIIPMIHEP